MSQRVFSIIAAAAIVALSACETTDGNGPTEDITWNTPRAASSAPPPPVAGAPEEPQCREYQTTIIVGGQPQKAYGRACRQPDGTWKDETGFRDTPHSADRKAPIEDSYPYGWYGYDYPYGPRRTPFSLGAGYGGGGGYVGYGVGF